MTATVSAPPEAPATAQAAAARPSRWRRSRGGLLIAALSVALVVVTIVSAGRGQLQIPPAEVVGSILHRLDANLEWLLRQIG